MDTDDILTYQEVLLVGYLPFTNLKYELYIICTGRSSMMNTTGKTIVISFVQNSRVDLAMNSPVQSTAGSETSGPGLIVIHVSRNRYYNLSNVMMIMYTRGRVLSAGQVHTVQFFFSETRNSYKNKN